MRMNLFHSKPLAQFAQTCLDSANLHALMRSIEAYKQGFVFIGSAIKIILEVHFRSRIEIYHSFFIPFAYHYTLALMEVNIGTIERHHFPDTHSSGG